MLTRARVSLRRLFAWTTLYAILLGVLTSLPLLPLQIVAAFIIFTVFIIADSLFDWKYDTAPPTARFAITIAYYASALAAVVLGCYLLYLVLPEPPSPPTPALSFWGTVYHLVSGQFAHDIGTAVGRAITIALTYVISFGVFSTIAFVAAICARRHYRAAKWFALASWPGAGLLLGIVAEYTYNFFIGP